MTNSITLKDRARGVLLGLACGDALGRPVEFKSPTEIQRTHGTVTDMLGDGTYYQPAGTVTDDTQMALCLANSLVTTGEFDPEDIANRYVTWLNSGPFDIGNMTRNVLEKLRDDGSDWRDASRLVWTRSSEGSNAGNGSLMRTAPLAVAFHGTPELFITSPIESRITHYDERCQEACLLYNLTLARLLNNLHDPLQPVAVASHSETDDVPQELIDALFPVRDDTIDPETLSNTGYVVDTIQTALYDALNASDAEQAIITSVNRGGDADTLGAVCGAAAGARFGASALPNRWIDTLHVADELTSLADSLCEREFDVDTELHAELNQ